jgi:hypothetical protein
MPDLPDSTPPPSVVPPVIAPEDHEEFPTFRETFLVFFTDPKANATMRALGKLLLDFTLATWGEWPNQPEGMFRASLRAAVADLRCAQGSLGLFHGSEAGPIPHGSTHRYTLVYLPSGRPVATFRSARHCKSLASELARLWVRWGGSEPTEDPAPLLQRFQRDEI